MLINASVTVWHYDEDAEKYTRTVAESVHWYETDGAEDEKGGFLLCSDGETGNRATELL